MPGVNRQENTFVKVLRVTIRRRCHHKRYMAHVKKPCMYHGVPVILPTNNILKVTLSYISIISRLETILSFLIIQ